MLNGETIHKALSWLYPEIGVSYQRANAIPGMSDERNRELSGRVFWDGID